MREFNLNNCKFDFTSDNINIIVLVYDYSGSMSDDKSAMIKANKAFASDFSRFEDKGSIAVAKVMFNNYVVMTSFASVDEFDTSYFASGGTEMYLGIDIGAENTILYYNEIVKRLNVRPRITFLVFTDGEDTSDSRKKYLAAVEAIKKLNSLDATTVFVAFGEARNNDISEKLGFTCKREINTTSELIQCLGKQLSKSCKEQSRSVYSLKSEFFSQANGNSEEDNVDDASIVDDDFFNI